MAEQTNPYIGDDVKQAQIDYNPDKNKQFEAKHRVSNKKLSVAEEIKISNQDIRDLLIEYLQEVGEKDNPNLSFDNEKAKSFISFIKFACVEIVRSFSVIRQSLQCMYELIDRKPDETQLSKSGKKLWSKLGFTFKTLNEACSVMFTVGRTYFGFLLKFWEALATFRDEQTKLKRPSMDVSAAALTKHLYDFMRFKTQYDAAITKVNAAAQQSVTLFDDVIGSEKIKNVFENRNKVEKTMNDLIVQIRDECSNRADEINALETDKAINLGKCAMNEEEIKFHQGVYKTMEEWQAKREEAIKNTEKNIETATKVMKTFEQHKMNYYQQKVSIDNSATDIRKSAAIQAQHSAQHHQDKLRQIDQQLDITNAYGNKLAENALINADNAMINISHNQSRRAQQLRGKSDNIHNKADTLHSKADIALGQSIESAKYGRNYKQHTHYDKHVEYHEKYKTEHYGRTRCSVSSGFLGLSPRVSYSSKIRTRTVLDGYHRDVSTHSGKADNLRNIGRDLNRAADDITNSALKMKSSGDTNTQDVAANQITNDAQTRSNTRMQNEMDYSETQIQQHNAQQNYEQELINNEKMMKYAAQMNEQDKMKSEIRNEEEIKKKQVDDFKQEENIQIIGDLKTANAKMKKKVAQFEKEIKAATEESMKKEDNLRKELEEYEEKLVSSKNEILKISKTICVFGKQLLIEFADITMDIFPQLQNIINGLEAIGVSFNNFLVSITLRISSSITIGWYFEIKNEFENYTAGVIVNALKQAGYNSMTQLNFRSKYGKNNCDEKFGKIIVPLIDKCFRKGIGNDNDENKTERNNKYIYIDNEDELNAKKELYTEKLKDLFVNKKTIKNWIKTGKDATESNREWLISISAPLCFFFGQMSKGLDFCMDELELSGYKHNKSKIKKLQIKIPKLIQKEKDEKEPVFHYEKKHDPWKKYLKQWGLDNYIEIFQEKEYNDSTIWNQLKKQDLKKELGMSKGAIMKFMSRRKELNKKKKKKSKKKDSDNSIEIYYIY